MFWYDLVIIDLISFTFQSWILYPSFCSGRMPGALVKTSKYSKFRIILGIPVRNFTLPLTLPYFIRSTLPYLTFYLTLCLTLPYLTLPYLTLPYLTSYLALPYRTSYITLRLTLPYLRSYLTLHPTLQTLPLTLHFTLPPYVLPYHTLLYILPYLTSPHLTSYLTLGLTYLMSYLTNLTS